jgi:large subunit ribosomal protein L24
MRKIRKGDTVEILSGDEKGKRGEVKQVLPARPNATKKWKARAKDRVVVAGLNLIKKHQRRTGDVNTQYGIIEREGPMFMSKVALVCPHCGKPTRVGFRVMPDGSKVRYCKKCGEVIP